MLTHDSRPPRLQSFLGLPVRARDDRGRQCTVFGLGFFAPSRADVDLDRTAFRRLRHLVALEAGTATTGEVAGRIYAGSLAFIVAFVVFVRWSWTVPGVIACIVFCLFGMHHSLRGLTATRRMPPVRAQPVIAVLRRVGRCAACAHTLANIAPEADGCTICPECGGAWRLDAQPRTTSPAQTTAPTGSPPNS